jgi:hypothetical protein
MAKDRTAYSPGSTGGSPVGFGGSPKRTSVTVAKCSEQRVTMKLRSLFSARDAGEPPVLPGKPVTHFVLARVLANAGALWCLMLIGCAATDHRIGPSALARPTVIGSVAVVDEEKRFVLIDLESNLYVPPPGAILRTANPRGETGRLRTSPEEKRPFVAADIEQGNPAVGDQVLR